MSPPEFSIICRIRGGPSTTVFWYIGEIMEEYIESHQLIVDTSQNCIYENRLLVKRRYNGTCTCTVLNIYIRNYFPNANSLVQEIIRVTGMIIIIVYMFSTDMYSCW